MAYIVEVTFEDGEKEIVPIWSSAFIEEMYSLERANEDLSYVSTLTRDPDEETCKHYDSLVERTKYVLPKEFKENRKRRLREEVQGV